jgi:hypothetical protein
MPTVVEHLDSFFFTMMPTSKRREKMSLDKSMTSSTHGRNIRGLLMVSLSISMMREAIQSLHVA